MATNGYSTTLSSRLRLQRQTRQAKSSGVGGFTVAV